MSVENLNQQEDLGKLLNQRYELQKETGRNLDGGIDSMEKNMSLLSQKVDITCKVGEISGEDIKDVKLSLETIKDVKLSLETMYYNDKQTRALCDFFDKHLLQIV